MPMRLHYTPVAADEGKLLRTMVSYGDAIGSARSAVSASTQKVGKPGEVSLNSHTGGGCRFGCDAV